MILYGRITIQKQQPVIFGLVSHEVADCCTPYIMLEPEITAVLMGLNSYSALFTEFTVSGAVIGYYDLIRYTQYQALIMQILDQL